MVMSDYERIRRSCVKRGELWEDPDFPATQSSVFYHQTPPFQFTWKRPKDLCSRPEFVQDGAGQFDIIPGKMALERANSRGFTELPPIKNLVIILEGCLQC
uniref:Calpain catalytic domain-containing protein n=1 Tax=Photinus pyralis TaxID=7054 RepID=A0A1Y1LJW8_PHOPY